jgi:hypothetical protein
MATVYNNAKELLLNGGVDFGNDTIKLLVYDNTQAYTPDPDDGPFVDDIIGVSATEMSGTGYSRKTLTVTVTQDDTDDEGVMDASDVTFSGLDAGTIQGWIIYKEVTNDTDSPVILATDDGDIADLPLTTNGSDVTIQWNAEGILNLT